MKRKTKTILNLFFACGLVTAALSVGRAATTNRGSLTEDTTWRSVPSGTFSLVEARLGVILASARKSMSPQFLQERR